MLMKLGGVVVSQMNRVSGNSVMKKPQAPALKSPVSRGSRLLLLGPFVALVAHSGGADRIRAAELGQVPLYKVTEVSFSGPELGPADTPARDVELTVTFRHESGSPEIPRLGFWAGDGRGGTRGNVFKVRFTPTRRGTWRIVKTSSNHSRLRGQWEGSSLLCVPSSLRGFWLARGRWYSRSDGSRPFIVGNTHYSFLSRRRDNGPAKSDPVLDIRLNARYFSKLRFTLFGDRYPDPGLKPFLDQDGRQSDDGRFSLRPNPAWFHERVDPVVEEGFAQDLVCDLILCGPDTREARSTLKENPLPWLRYVAARYGAYPNVWFCLGNEWDIKNPSYSAAAIRTAGEALRSFLPYPTPISVHGKPAPWTRALNGAWHDHVIIQRKVKKLPQAADFAAESHVLGGRKPVVNDENGYQGKGDGFSEGDVIEGCLGTFLGGGYPTTGEKHGRKLGQYFWGGFDARAHSASDNLAYLRFYIEREVAFWRLAPQSLKGGIFAALPGSFRLLAAEDEEYVLGSNQRADHLRVKLPAGSWRVSQVDIVKKNTVEVASAASGTLTFATPASRAVLTHFRKATPRQRRRDTSGPR